MSLAAVLIVKNEAEHLEKCLSTARPHVDEIVVVDTGSTDGTQEIARQYADVFEEIEWPDSFSVARNRSFDLASGDYIMWLDGDEHIAEDQHWQNIRKTLAEVNVAGAEVMLRNIVPENQILQADCAYQIRIVVNDPLIRFEGKVHNQIYRTLQRYHKKTKESIVRIKAEVIHVGYALEQEKMAAKYRERLHLLEQEVENAEDAVRREYYRYQLGNAYFMLKKMKKAAETFADLDYRHLTDANAYFTHFMHSFAHSSLGQPEEAFEHAEAMMQMNPEEPGGYVLAGEALSQAKQKEAAMTMFLKAYETNLEGQGSIRFDLDEYYLFYLIAVHAGQLKLYDRAKFFIEKYLEKYPDSEKGLEVKQKLDKILGRATSLSTS